MIKLITGNLLEADAEALVNTVNTVGLMGKGIALQFKQAYPDNYEAYRKACSHQEVQPGKMFVFPVCRENCITYWCKSSRGNSAVHPCSLREASGETRSVKFSDKVSIREMSNPAGCSVSEPI